MIARHYLDALEAVPGAPDVDELRSQAVAALVRAADRAKRTGAPAQAAAATPPPPNCSHRRDSRDRRRGGFTGRDAVGRRAARRPRQRRLWRGSQVCRPGPQYYATAWPRRAAAGLGHCLAWRWTHGAQRRSARGAHCGAGGTACRPGRAHGARAGTSRVTSRCSTAQPSPKADHRGAHPWPGPRRRRWPAQRPVHYPRDLSQLRWALQPAGGRLLARKRSA